MKNTLILIALCLATLSAQARILNVPSEYSTIQAGIDSSANGDTVLVAPGLYHERINFNGHNIVLGSNYLTTGDTSFIASTIIDGDLAGTVITFDHSENSTTILKGFTIQRGRGLRGGGILCLNSSPTINFNIIKNNLVQAGSGDPDGSMGGGICCLASTSSITNNTFFYNGANSPGPGAAMGGGLYFGPNSHPRISNNYFFRNFATGKGMGGAIGCLNSSSILIENNIITADTARMYGGGIYINGGSNALIKGNTISLNRSHLVGGGLNIESCPNSIISANNFEDNAAAQDNGPVGGGLRIHLANGSIISNNNFKRNAGGTGVGCGGGISATSINNLNIDNNNFIENTSPNAGALFLGSNTNTVITSNLMVNNWSRTYGGAIYSTTSISVEIRGNTICNNTASSGGGVYLTGAEAQIINSIIWYNSVPQISGSAVVSYSDIQGGYNGTENINIIPHFFVPGNLIYSLCEDSPCIDSGNPFYIDPDGTRSDIGAFRCRLPELEMPQVIGHLDCSYQECRPLGSVLNVAITGNDSSGDGSFTYPFRTIQHATNLAAFHDTILVHPGTFHENIVIDGGFLTLCSEFVYSNDSLSILSTIIDGDSTGPVITVRNLTTDSLTSIVGLTVQNGTLAGIHIVTSCISIKNNIIVNNWGSGIRCDLDNMPDILPVNIVKNTISYNHGENQGGGIASFIGNIKIDSNRISYNTALIGAGVYCYYCNVSMVGNIVNDNFAELYGGGYSGNSFNGMIESNVFNSNYANVFGGGLYSQGEQIRGNIIYGNSAGINGGGSLNSGTFRNNIVRRNHADSSGGGIWAAGGTIVGNIIDSNYCNNKGGGVYVFRAELDSNAISENRSFCGRGIYATGPGFYHLGAIKANNIYNNAADSIGGGIAFINYSYNARSSLNNIISANKATYGGGGIYCAYSWPLLTRNSIILNQSLYGGGIFTDHANPTLMNSVFYGNVADSTAGGLYLGDGSSPVIRNSIFWGDTALYGSEIWADSNTQQMIKYSDIQGGFTGQGNIDSDPLFRNPLAEDFHLMSTACGDSADSPCIDTGSLVDFDSLLSCSWGLGATRCDMGVYGGGTWQPVGIDDNQPPSLPQSFSLSQNYPNPFNPSTTIKYDVPAPCRVRIDIYDILGRRIAILADDEQTAGTHQAIWNASDKSSGLYFYRIQAGEFVETKKMMLVR